MGNQDIYTSDTLLDDGTMMRKVKLYNPEIVEFDPTIAYLKDDYYYIYRGSLQAKDSVPDLPGIYFSENSGKYLLFDPSTEDEKMKYRYSDKISSSTANEIVKKINTKEVEVYVLPGIAKAFTPTIGEDDDILKRLMKRVIIDKGIDLDRYKSRFIDKNALFNFKQVLKSDSRLSMLLFDRGVDAFNLKYTIVLEEGSGDIVGIPLQKPIIISSDDTYQITNDNPNDQSDNDDDDGDNDV